jgi:hypothetical protein
MTRVRTVSPDWAYVAPLEVMQEWLIAAGARDSRLLQAERIFRILIAQQAFMAP